MTKKVWLVAHPTYQYKEDVHKLALENNLEVVDLIFKDSFNADQLADKKDIPKLTKK